MSKRKLIIDTDPGVDDAFAIALALKSEEFDVIGITSSMGNLGLETTTTNVVKLAKYFGAKCKIYKGEDSYLTSGEKTVSKDVHGNDGLGGSGDLLEYDESYLSDIKAVDFILDSIKKYPNEIEIITLAPLTNIAKAIETDCEAMKKVKTIYSMGGGVKKGNITPYAEFNFFADPKALDVTLSIGNEVDIYMFGLDVTHQTIFTCNDFFFLNKACGEKGEVLTKMAKAYLDTYWKFSGYLGCVIHDLVVVAYVLDNSICPELKKALVTTEIDGDKKGITKCDFENTEKSNMIVASSIDTFKYKKLFIRKMFGEEICNNYEKTIKAMNNCNNDYNVKIVL